MAKETPQRRKAPGQGLRKSGPQNIAEGLAQNQVPSPGARAPAPDLHDLRERLVGVRRRLLQRLAEDWPDDRRFPDSAWCRMLSDVQGALQAADAVVAEGAP